MGKSHKKQVNRPQLKKNEGNTPKNGKDLINFNSEPESSGSDNDNVNKNGKVTFRPPLNTSGKCQRYFNAEAMDEDFAASSSSSTVPSTSSEISSASHHKNITQPQPGVITLNSADQTTFDQENQPHSEVPIKGKEIDSGMEVNPNLNKEPDDTISRDPNASRHAYQDNDEKMDDEATDDVTKFKAAIPFTELKKKSETKKQLLNHITDVMLDQFSSLFKVTSLKKALTLYS